MKNPAESSGKSQKKITATRPDDEIFSPGPILCAISAPCFAVQGLRCWQRPPRCNRIAIITEGKVAGILRSDEDDYKFGLLMSGSKVEDAKKEAEKE